MYNLLLRYNYFLIFAIILATTLCLKEIPGIPDILDGRDLKIGQLDDPGTTRNPIFNQFTYSSHKTISLNQTIYMEPNQARVEDYPTEQKTCTVDVYYSQFDLQQLMSFTYSQGYNSWFSPCMFSSSYNSYYFHELYQENGEYMASSRLQITCYKVTLNPEITLNPIFEQQLLDLPSIYNQTTCPHFKKLLETFGTHYVTSATMGGLVVMTTSFSEKIMVNTTTKDITEDLQTQFFLSTQETLSEEQQTQLIQLNAKYKSTFELLGGKPSSYNVTQYQIWASTVFSDPLIINMQIYNLTTLLHKNFTKNQQKIIALNTAIKEYFYSSYKEWQMYGSVPVAISECISNLWILPNSYALPSIDYITYAVIGDTIYFPVSYSYNPAYSYNMKTNLWSNMAPIPETIGEYLYAISCSAIEEQSLIYCFGINIQNKNFAYTYNTKTCVWNKYDSCFTQPFTPTGSTCVTVGNSIYLMGNSDGGGNIYPYSKYFMTFPNEIYIYDTINNTCESFFSYPPECVIYYQSVVVDDCIYIIGGRSCELYQHNDDSIWYNMSNSIQRFNTTDHYWHILAPLPELLYMPAVTTFDGKIYVMGGSSVSENVQLYPKTKTSFKPNYNAYEYDVSSNTWSLITSNSAVTAKMGISFSKDGFIFYISDDIKVIAPSNFC